MPRSNAIRGTLILLNSNAKVTNPYLDSTLFNFQFNPESLSHVFISEQCEPGSVPQGSMAELFNLTFDLESDDIDPQEQTPTTTAYGLQPVLAVLESMTHPYPTSNNQTQLPTTIFKWGANRVVPAKVVGMNVEEAAFDLSLNPTKATVTLSMRVIQKSELKTDSPAYKICLDHLTLRDKLVGLYKAEHPQLEQSVGAVAGLAGTSSSTSAADSASVSLAGAAGVSTAQNSKKKIA
jgi:hypothetical protein